MAALPGVTAARAKMTADVKARGGFGRAGRPRHPQHHRGGRGQGRGGEVDDLGEPGRGPAAQGRARGPHGRRRLRPEHPADARASKDQPEVSDDKKMIPPDGPRHQGHLHGHAGAARPGHHLARAHAPRRGAAVHARRGLGRARLPDRGPAPGHRRRVAEHGPERARGGGGGGDDAAGRLGLRRAQGGRACSASSTSPSWAWSRT